MAKDPAVLFYTSDFLTGTSFFTDEQMGQYIKLLCEQHQLYTIPKNHMISVCKSLDSPVVKKFILDSNGEYYNERMRNEAIKRKKYCESRGNNKSGKKKAKNIRKTYENHMENEDENINIIINYLNTKANKNYRSNTKKTISLINSRLKDGFSIEDFKKVIDNKVKDWLNNNDMNEYLRPETLFGNKFEGYLNKKNIKIDKTNINSQWD